MKGVECLSKQNIDILIQTPRVVRESNNPEELDIVKKYKCEDRLHYSKWRNIQFKVKNSYRDWETDRKSVV